MRVEVEILMFTYGFALDNGVNHLRNWLPHGRSRSLSELGLTVDASDAAIVRKAVEESLIIVTANGDDFLREIEVYRKTSTRNKGCHDANGLLIVMDAHRPRRTFQEVTASLRLDRTPVSWANVTDDNLLVRLMLGDRVSVTMLPRCFYCARESA